MSHQPVWSWSAPSDSEVERFREQQGAVGFSYAEVGASLDQSPPGYTLDHNRVKLGEGEEVFARACAALRAWKMFPSPWTEIRPPDTPIERGRTVVMLAQGWGMWWMNACRIVYVLDEMLPVRRFGFAYGTLSAHVEQGEERFSIELHADGSVWYDLRAFSRPRYWPVRLARPFARRLQRKFVRDSLASMVRACEACY